MAEGHPRTSAPPPPDPTPVPRPDPIPDPTSVPIDPVEIPGPWAHRHVAANGARFHVVEAGPAYGRMVLLLHGFPEFWWAWRDQLPALAVAGHRAVAMDLRGYGGSDKTPDGYDPVTLAGDVAAVVQALGAREAVVVGHGWGGYVAWATASLHPREVTALAALSAPHPLTMLGALRSSAGREALRHVLSAQVPMVPERRLARASSGYLHRHLERWRSASPGPGPVFPDPVERSTYEAAMGLWPSSHCALEYHRWLFRSRLRADGRRFRAAARRPLDLPVCLVSGVDDPVLDERTVAGSRRWLRGPVTEHRLPGVGHFPHEEDAATTTALLLDWLTTLDAG